MDNSTFYAKVRVNGTGIPKDLRERHLEFDELRNKAIKAIEALYPYVAYQPDEGSVASASLIIKNIKLFY